MDCPRRNYTFGETAKIKLLVSRYEDEPTDRAVLRWELRRGKDVLASGSKQGLKIGSGGVQDLMPVDLAMPRLPAAAKLTLAVTLADLNGIAANDWPFWAFPQEPLKDPARELRWRGIEGFEKLYPWARELKARPEPADCDLLVATQCDEAALAYLEQGGRLLLLDPDPLFKAERVSGFRPAGWDPGQQGGHVGTAVRIDHPALEKLPCEGWCDLQFYPLLMGAKFAVLDDTVPKIDPIVRSIDVPQRLSNRAFLFEVRLGKGALLVSGLNFAGALKSNDPAAAYLLDQLVRYGLSADFAPQAALSKLSLRPGVKAAQTLRAK